MASTTVAELLDRAQTILQDTTATRWPRSELLNWMNDSYKEIILARPDAYTQAGTFRCAQGVRQDITAVFPSAIRLIEVVYNETTNTSVRLIDRQVLDDQRTNWYGESATNAVSNYMFDVRVPKKFLVYPPATSTTDLELVYTAVPDAHTDETGTIKLDDSYGNAMLDYILYRAYSKDADYAANAQRAVGHFEAFRGSLGLSAEAVVRTRPGTGEAGRPAVTNPAERSRVT